MTRYPNEREADFERIPHALTVLLLYALAQVVSAIVVLPLLLVWLRQRRVGLRLLAPSLRGSVRAVTLGLALAGLTGGVRFVTYSALLFFFPERASGWYFPDHGWLYFGGPSAEILAMIFIYLVLVIPLFEEIVFRRCAFPWMETRWGFQRAALVNSGVFAVFHYDAVAVSAFIFGLVTCLVYQGTRNLLYPILIHASTNLVSVVFAAIAASSAPYTTEELSQLYLSLWYPGLAGLLIGGGFVSWVLIRQWPRGDRIAEQATVSDA